MWGPCWSAAAHAQTNSNSSTVALTATLPESLTISASPASVSFTLVQGGAAFGSSPVSITTTWLVSPASSSVALFGWFTTPAAALTDGASTPDNIPSSEVYGQVSSGAPTSYTAFTQSNALGSAQGGLELFTQSLSSTNFAGTRTDSLNLEIDLTNQPELPSGVYNGTLNLQAQVL